MATCPLIVVGSGGFSKDVVWAVHNHNAVHAAYELLGFCDDDRAKKGQLIAGYPVLGTPEEVAATAPQTPCFLCSIGDNSARARVVERVLSLGWTPVTIIDPSVMIADEVEIGLGTYVGARAIISPKARIGNHVIINNHTTIGHDCVVADFAQVSPGARVSGFSVLEEGALLGANAVIAQGRKLGRYGTLGACSFGMIDIPEGATATGIPARVTFRR
ncbi:MAG: acetyltransferase [Chloroflexi bacterium]|nr:acetyltransferase [Chloroflexota bacterium]